MSATSLTSSDEQGSEAGPAPAPDVDAPGAPVVQGRALRLAHQRQVVFDGIDVQAGAGDLLVISGPVGSGKTCLALALAGRLRLSGGELRVCGASLPKQAAAVRRAVALAEFRGINSLDDALTVEQHIAERLAIHQPWWKPWVTRARVLEVLERVQHLLASTDERAEQLLRAAQAASGDARGTGGAGEHAAPDGEPASLPVVVPPLRPEEYISDLQPLERMALGVVLALIGQPEVLVVDDVDALRATHDRHRAWAALTALDAVHTADGGRRPLTVVATCQDPGPIAAVARAQRAGAADPAGHELRPDRQPVRTIHLLEMPSLISGPGSGPATRPGPEEGLS